MSNTLQKMICQKHEGPVGGSEEENRNTSSMCFCQREGHILWF